MEIDLVLHSDPLWASIDKAIGAVEGKPHIVWEKKPEWDRGLNSKKINELADDTNLSGNPVFQMREDPDGDTVQERWLDVFHPVLTEPVEIHTWSRLYWEPPTRAEVDRLISFLRDWQEMRAGQLRGQTQSPQPPGSLAPTSVGTSASAGAAVVATDAEKQPPLAKGKEVPWNPDDPDSIPAKDAVRYVKEIISDFDYRRLNAALKHDGPMHYMVNPDPKDKGPGSVRCRVRKGDLETWCDGLKRGARTKRGRQENNASGPTNVDAASYEMGFAEGRQEGYRKGYEEVKRGKPCVCQPPFEDDPKDEYAHAHYEGWKNGYTEGRLDSETGEPQKYGVQQ